MDLAVLAAQPRRTSSGPSTYPLAPVATLLEAPQPGLSVIFEMFARARWLLAKLLATAGARDSCSSRTFSKCSRAHGGC